MDYVLVLAGIALLVFSGDWLVRAGSALASYFRIPPIIVGVTVISFGTSAPELFVSVNASMQGLSDVAIGNVVGSNIVNIGLVLAVSALIIAIPIQWSTIKLDFPFLILSSFFLGIFMIDYEISRIEGVFLLFAMLVYILMIIHSLKKDKVKIAEPTEKRRWHPALSFLIIVISCGGLVVGSKLLVEGAVTIAIKAGVSERIISLTIIAIGTSLPELTTSVIAAIRKNFDISVGNVIGSNIFNILVILGISSVIKPLNVNTTILHLDFWFMIGFVILLGLFFFPIKRLRISRWEGFFFILAYAAYYVVLFI